MWSSMRKAADLNWVAPWSVKELIYYWIKVPLEKDIKRIWKAAICWILGSLEGEEKSGV